MVEKSGQEVYAAACVACHGSGALGAPRFENKGDFEVLVEGDDALFNQYGVIRVSPEHCPNVKTEAGQEFVDWITGPDGQQAIADYQLNGQQLFFPNAKEGLS